MTTLYQHHNVGETLEKVVDDAYSELQTLGEEMREWADQLEEKFSGTTKYDDVSSAADTLEGTEGPELPDRLKSQIVPYVLMSTQKGKIVENSRALRCSNAVSRLQAVVDLLRGVKEEGDTTQEEAEEAQELADFLENTIDEAEGVEFPGAY